MKTGRRITVLDGWRGLSIALVLMGHFFPNPIVNLGAWGVEWFFVLSGRLMADILFIRRAPLREFYRRRLSRILPVVLVFVPVMFIAFYNTQAHFKPLDALAALTFTLNYASVIQGHQVPVIAHIWSLCVEEHTYILLGILAFLARRHRWRVLPTLCVAAIASALDLIICSSFPLNNFFDVTWRTDAHIYAILFGSIAYLLARRHLTSASAKSVICAIAIVAALLIEICNYWVYREAIRVLSTLALALAVATLEASPPMINRLLGFAPLRRLGIMSFSIYIWQQPFYWTAQQYQLSAGVTVAMLGGALLTGIASFYVIEQPARRWLNQLRLPKPEFAENSLNAPS